jgi:phosphoribosylformimino-5-aminoimidazole carboxamide ribotide isomerase
MLVRPASITRALRVIGVVDLRGGVAVHARGGRRDEYEPIGDAVEVARTYVDRYGVEELYVADLDAIEDRERGSDDRESDDRGPERAALRTIAGMAAVWLDAGISSVERARQAMADGAARVIVGLETLPSFDVLREICEAIGGQHVAFSLDLRDETPLGIGARDVPTALAVRAADAGVSAIIVLDLARVGMRTGVDMNLLKAVRNAVPQLELVAGGGVRDADDLARLEDAGVNGALVATALRDGRLAALKAPPYKDSR